MPEKYIRLSKKNWSDLTISEMIYLNACECLYYGYGYNTLNKCGMSDFVAKPIFMEAFNDMAND